LPDVRYYFAVASYAGSFVGPRSVEVSGISNATPKLVNPGNQTTLVGSPVVLQLSGSDPLGELVSYRISGLPPGLTLALSTGLITGVTTTAGTYAVTATVTDGVLSSSQSFTWTVTAPASGTPPPPWTLSASPSTIQSGQSSVLSFTTGTSDVHSILISGQRPTYSCDASKCSGTLTVKPSASTTYTLTSTNSSGAPYPAMNVTVTVGAPPAPTWTFTAVPASIRPGQSSLLSFTTTTTNFHSVRINGAPPAYTCGGATCSGSLTVKPGSTTIYRLTSSDASGAAYPTLTVTVTVE
jgi:hypothetical protein